MAENSKIRKERSSAVAEDKKREEKVLPPWRKIKNVKGNCLPTRRMTIETWPNLFICRTYERWFNVS